MQNNRKVGAEREKRTAALLERKGYRILEKNFRCRSGEIDIIASHKEYLVFVEVKYRRNAGKGFAGEAVNYRKMQSICRTADYYMVTHCKKIPPVRFDVAAWDGETLTVYENAFEYIPGGGR